MTVYDKLSLLAQYLIFLATLIYAWIAHRQLKAIDTSAKAATLSATAALQGNRPILVIADIEIYGFKKPATKDSTVREVAVSFRFQNRGGGIAFVKNVQARLAFADESPKEPWRDNLLFFSDPLIGPGEATPSFRVPPNFGVIIDDAKRHAMNQIANQLELRGRIDYTDMAQQERFTRFAFGFMPPYPGADEGRFYRLPGGNEYDAYAEQRYRVEQQPKGYFARLKSLFSKK